MKILRKNSRRMKKVTVQIEFFKQKMSNDHEFPSITNKARSEFDRDKYHDFIGTQLQPTSLGKQVTYDNVFDSHHCG